jgi:hypothetical protein
VGQDAPLNLGLLSHTVAVEFSERRPQADYNEDRIHY